LLFLALVWLAASSCTKKNDESTAGSGVQASATRTVPPFARLSVGSMLEVSVKVGSDGPLEIKGDDNLLPHVTSRVENGMLTLDVDVKAKKSMPLEARVSTRRLEAVNASVASKVDIQGLSAEKFAARAAGAGRVTAAGSAQSLELVGKGAARLDFAKVPAREASVHLDHASQAKLGYLEKLKVTASGASLVYYSGEPALESALKKPARLIRVEP
jgi:hypothetical protein